MRRADWERRLHDVLDGWRHATCVRDRHCGDLGADAVEAVTGRDVRAAIEARTAAQVAAVFKRHGARSIGDVLTALFGAPVPGRRAARGDLVLRGRAIGVVTGERVAFLGDGGLSMLPLQAADRAWKL